MEKTDEIRQPGYVELIRSNVHFRRLWISNVISLLGDWFNFIALINVIGSLTGSPFALGLIFIAKMLPVALVSPVAGLIVDRFDRRHLMILSDLVRAAVVALLVLADYLESTVFVYTLIVLQVVVSAVFQPAQSASIPNVTSRSELLTANTLMAASWSVMLAIGAALGGVATALFGARIVFVIDAISYVVSAYFLYRAVIPQESAGGFSGGIFRTANREIIEGWRYLMAHGPIARIATAKATWALAGGALVYMLTLAGSNIDPGSADVAIGVLFAARGVGTGIGPVFARHTFRDKTRWPAVLGGCVVFSGIVYTIFGALPWGYGLALLVIIAHSASGANWVLASVLLQERTVDRYRGRVFATEWLLVMIADTLSILGGSLLLEHGILSVRQGFLLFAVLQAVLGMLWLWAVIPREKADEAAV